MTFRSHKASVPSNGDFCSWAQTVVSDALVVVLSVLQDCHVWCVMESEITLLSWGKSHYSSPMGLFFYLEEGFV